MSDTLARGYRVVVDKNSALDSVVIKGSVTNTFLIATGASAPDAVYIASANIQDGALYSANKNLLLLDETLLLSPAVRMLGRSIRRPSPTIDILIADFTEAADENPDLAKDRALAFDKAYSDTWVGTRPFLFADAVDACEPIPQGASGSKLIEAGEFTPYEIN